MRSRRVLIVGGGIGGAALAIALAQRNVNVELIEKQANWHSQSSGIFIYSNGLAAYERLGLLDDVRSAGWAIEDGRSVYVTPDGELITETFYPRMAGSAAPPIVGIKRSELHRVTTKAVASLSINVRLGTAVTELNDSSDGPVSVRFSDGHEREYDAVVRSKRGRYPQ